MDFNEVIEVTTKNSTGSLEQLLSKEDTHLHGNFIHRKNMGDKIRFNPNFKAHILKSKEEDYNTFSFLIHPSNGKVYMKVMENQDGIRVPNTANFKAKTLVEILDSAYKEHELVNTNRYSLTYVQKDEEKGFLFFEITPSESVEEAVRTISDERREELKKQLEKGRATSAAKRSEVEEDILLDNSPEITSPEANTEEEIIFSEV